MDPKYNIDSPDVNNGSLTRLLEEIIVSMLFDVSHSIFWNMLPQARETKAKINK